MNLSCPPGIVAGTIWGMSRYLKPDGSAGCPAGLHCRQAIQAEHHVHDEGRIVRASAERKSARHNMRAKHDPELEVDIDRVLADSFPASDPPSWVPTTAEAGEAHAIEGTEDGDQPREAAVQRVRVPLVRSN
jgi:hypothetical protein